MNTYYKNYDLLAFVSDSLVFVSDSLVEGISNSCNSAGLSDENSSALLTIHITVLVCQVQNLWTISNSCNSAGLSDENSSALLPIQITMLVYQVQNHWHYYQII